MAWTKMAAVQVGGGCKICIASYLDGRLEGFDFPVHHLNSAVAAAAAAGLFICLGLGRDRLCRHHDPWRHLEWGEATD